MALPHDSDAILFSVLRDAEEWNERVSRSSLVRLLIKTYGYGHQEAKAVVQDYCIRHSLTLTEPKSHPWYTFAGCIFALLIPVFFVFALFGMIAGIPKHSVSPSLEPTWLASTKYGWAFLLTAFLLYDLRGKKLRRSLCVLRQIRPSLVAQNLVVIAVTIGVALLLDRVFPFLDRSWLYLLPGSNGHAANINIIPANIKYFGPFFLLLLALSMPGLARSEELRYRKGTRNWTDATGRSMKFGLVHCFVGIPIYAGLALTVAGLWFTFQYFRGGVERSMLHHTVYNITVVAVLFTLILFHR